MITLTDTAARKVKELLDAEGASDLALRVAVRPGGCSGFSYEMFFDGDFAADDQQTTYGEAVKVVVDSASAQLLEGATLDYKDGLTVSGLTLCESGKVECVTIVAKKEIAGNSRPFNIATPLIPIDQPEEGEGSHLTIAQAILVETALEEARKYIRGERSQGQMKLAPEADTEVVDEDEHEAGEPGNLIAIPALS